MPIVPVLAAVGGALGAGAGSAALVGGLAIAGTAAAVGTSVYGASQATKAAKMANGNNSSVNANASQQVDGMSSSTQNAGRAALISTSPSGVQGLDPTGRRKLLGN